MTSRFGRLAGLALASIMAACTTATDPATIATITLQPGLDSVEVGQTFSGWNVTVRDKNGTELTGRKLTWSSQNTAVATIDENTGTLTAVSTGQTLVTVAGGGKSAQATLRVITPILSIVLSPDSFDVPLTQVRAISIQLVGPGGQAIANRTVTWSSSNPAVATVNTSGVVTSLTLGTVTVTAAAGSKQATVRARVVAEPVSTVRILPNQSVHVVRLGQGRQLTAECVSGQGTVLTGRTVIWNSSNPLVASVGTNGLVTGVSIGQAQVTATCDQVPASVTIQVTPVPVTSVSITPSPLNILVNQQGQLTATARDSANNVLSLQNRTVSWTSDNLPVATVSQQGVAAGVSAGVAHVQVSVDGVLSQSIDVNVSNAPVATVTVGPVPASVKVGFQIQLTVTLKDSQGNVLTGRAFSCTSSDPSIATIGVTSCIATGVAVGVTTITVTSEGQVGQIQLNVIP